MNDEQSEAKSAELESAKLLWQSVVNGATLKDIQGVPDRVLEGIYAHAYKFYQLGRYDDAEVFFRFLCLYDAYNPDFMMGLAATLQQKKQYHQAIATYELAFVLAKNDYRPKLHIGQCYLFLKNKEQAQESFAMILKSDASESVKAQAGAYLGTLKLPAELGDNNSQSS